MERNDLWDLTLEEAQALINSGTISASELTEACLGRLAQREPEIHAFVEHDAEAAREQAALLDKVPSDDRGALHGIPIGVKDLIDVRGFRTRAGSKVLEDAVPADGDAPAVESFRRAGSVVFGKTTTHEFAYGCETPPTRNPWDSSRIAGGSSGGSAAAVAAGECLGALGTDSGGSIRIPAALCGITGLRPLVGASSLARTVPFSRTHDTIGPIAHTAAGVAQMWSALVDTPVAQAADPGSIGLAVVDDLEALGRFDHDAVTTYQAAVTELSNAGCGRHPRELPGFDEWGGSRSTVVLSEFLAEHTAAGWYPDRYSLYSPELQRYFSRAETLRGADLILAHRHLDELAARFRASLDGLDALLLPTVPIEAPRAASIDSAEGVGITENTARLVQMTAPVSYTGLAALSVPCGLSSNGMPLGLQIIGRDEQTVLSIGMLFQQVTNHHTLRPPRDGSAETN